MKKNILSFFSAVIIVSLISCNSSRSGDRDEVQKDNKTQPQPEKDPVKDTRPLMFMASPNEFGMTELIVTKNEEQGESNCAGKGNISAEFTLSFTDTVSKSGFSWKVSDYDCGEGVSDGREGESSGGKYVKHIYELLQKCKNEDVAIVYTLKDSVYLPEHFVIREKRVPAKDGGPSKVEPQIMVK